MGARAWTNKEVGFGSGLLRFSLPESLTQHSDQSAWADAAISDPFDLSDYVFSTVKFAAVAQRQTSTGVCSVRLYDHTNSSVITSSPLTPFTSLAEIVSSALTVGSSAGNMRNDGNTIYKVQIQITGGTPGVDYISLYNAHLILE